jgi:hypothetical protein
MSGEGMEMDATTRAMPRQGWVSGCVGFGLFGLSVSVGFGGWRVGLRADHQDWRSELSASAKS